MNKKEKQKEHDLNLISNSPGGSQCGEHENCSQLKKGSVSYRALGKIKNK